MKLLATIILVSLSLTACGSEGDNVVADPGGGSAVTPPATVPAAPGPVRSRNLATVMDVDTTDDRVELCLGAVAESYPPQCGGPAIIGWDWKDHRQMYEQQGTVRWGTFAVTGTWDGEEFTVTDAIPGPLYDAMYEEPPTYPEPAVQHTDAELEGISNGLSDLPGYQSSAPIEGRVLMDLIYDDGIIQDYLDATYGENVVIAVPALVDVAR